MKIGAKIYYDNRTGEILVNTGERTGDVRETTEDEDYAAYTSLKNRERDIVGVLQLAYGQYVADYAEGGRIDRIDLETGTPLFVYPDPTGGAGPAIPQPPLSERLEKAEEEVKTLRAADLDNKEMINGLGEMIMSLMEG